MPLLPQKRALKQYRWGTGESKNFCDFTCGFAIRPILCYCFFAIMYTFLKGRLIVVRLTLMAATISLLVVGTVTIYSVGHPAEPGTARRPLHIKILPAPRGRREVVFDICNRRGFNPAF